MERVFIRQPTFMLMVAIEGRGLIIVLYDRGCSLAAGTLSKVVRQLPSEDQPTTPLHQI